MPERAEISGVEHNSPYSPHDGVKEEQLKSGPNVGGRNEIVRTVLNKKYRS